jgi:hypothetical protein
MEKIAFKNTQQGSPNTYEIATRVPQHLIASNARFDEIKALESVTLNITSQVREEGYGLPVSIVVTSVVLYFAQANAQNMKLVFAGATFDENFVAPSGEGVVVLTVNDIEISQGDFQRMDIYNLDDPSTAPDPVLSSWCFTYEIPA